MLLDWYKNLICWRIYMQIVRPEFFYQLIYGIFFFRFRVGGMKKVNKKTLKMTS